MVTTYEEYLESSGALTIEEMQEIHRDLIAELGRDGDAMELYDGLIAAANRYASFRAEWLTWTKEQKMDKDSLRTSGHDSLIIHFNMLERYLRQQGKPASWRDRLGYEEQDKINRKRIGDFACYMVFVNSLNAR